MISQQTIASIIEVAKIEEVIQDFITIKKKGNNYWACCPFHHEKTPSFSISPAKGFYKCFGCGVAGNAITFIKALEGISFVEAIQYLGKKYGITIEEDDNENYTEEKQTKESIYILLEKAQKYYENILFQHNSGKIGQSYCMERNIPRNLIKKFGLGYSQASWDNFCLYAKSHHYSEEILLLSGLAMNPKDKIYDRFRGRLMFPIQNLSGKVIGFGGRILAVDTVHEPKYINSPETLLYQKRKIVYGIYQAKKAILKQNCCFVVEGYTDVIALHKANIENVVAPLGTSLTEEHLQIINRFTKNIILIFDHDIAGIQAVLKCIDLILQLDMEVKIITLPSEEDPDSFVQKNTLADVQAYFTTQQQDFVQFKAKVLLHGKKNDTSAQSATIKAILQSLMLIQDPITRMLYLKKCSTLFQVEEETLLAACNRILLKKQPFVNKEKVQHKSILEIKKESTADFLEQGIHIQERESLRMLLFYGHMTLENNMHLYKYLLDAIADITFTVPIHQAILDEYKQKLNDGIILDIQHFIHHKDEEKQKFVIDFLVDNYTISNSWQDKYHIDIPQEEDDLSKNVFKGVLRLKFRLVQKLIEDNLAALKNCEIEDKIFQLLDVHEALKKTEMTIAKQLGIILTR